MADHCAAHQGKRAYTSKRAAKAGAAAVAMKNGDRRMPTYRCHDCGKWFLTSGKGANRTI